MRADRYQKLVKRTMNNDLSKNEKLSMLCMGIAGEAGEFVDHVKKHIYHGHDLDKNKAAKELGDLLWYVGNSCNELQLSLEEVMVNNIKKLENRYPEGFSSERSKNRSEYKEPTETSRATR